ncbi:MAG: hypothetical protein PVF28_04665 [Thioalkalispiraceae bacterium]
MLIRSLLLVSISLLLTSLSVASSNEKTKLNPADKLNQPDNAQPQDIDKKSMPPPTRGQLLYEHHCLKCHESNVHIRNANKAKNIGEVQTWVTRWQAHEKLDWDSHAIDAVTNYLVKRYYKFNETE